MSRCRGGFTLERERDLDQHVLSFGAFKMYLVTSVPEEMALTHVIIQDFELSLQSESGVLHWD